MTAPCTAGLLATLHACTARTASDHTFKAESILRLHIYAERGSMHSDLPENASTQYEHPRMVTDCVIISSGWSLYGYG